MLTLLVWACLVSAPTDCRVIQIANGFVSDDQCGAYAPLMIAGWEKLVEGRLVRKPGYHHLCVPNPEWFLHRFGA